MQNAARDWAASELQIGDFDTHPNSIFASAPQIDALEIWACRTLARSTLFACGEIELQAAVDTSWQTAVEYGLVDEYGADAVQSAMALAFGAVRC